MTYLPTIYNNTKSLCHQNKKNKGQNFVSTTRWYFSLHSGTTFLPVVTWDSHRIFSPLVSIQKLPKPLFFFNVYPTEKNWNSGCLRNAIVFMICCFSLKGNNHICALHCSLIYFPFSTRSLTDSSVGSRIWSTLAMFILLCHSHEGHTSEAECQGGRGGSADAARFWWLGGASSQSWQTLRSPAKSFKSQ